MDDMQPEQTFEQIEKYKEYCRERCWSAVENALMRNQAQPDLITQMQNGIKATDADDTYSCGMRNGMRWCISLIDGKEPLYENCPPAQAEPCEDAASRQVAIDTLLKWMWPICINNEEVIESDDMVAVRNILKSLLPAQPKQRWTPVTERLPNDYTDVLVWFEYFRYGDYNCLYQTYGIGNYSTKYDSWTINHETGWDKLQVIAWMPLPKPYKEEKS